MKLNQSTYSSTVVKGFITREKRKAARPLRRRINKLETDNCGLNDEISKIKRFAKYSDGKSHLEAQGVSGSMGMGMLGSEEECAAPKMKRLTFEELRNAIMSLQCEVPA